MKLVNKPKNYLSSELILKGIELVEIHYRQFTKNSVRYSNIYVLIPLEAFDMSKY